MAFTQAILDEYIEPTEFSELKRTAALPAILKDFRAGAHPGCPRQLQGLSVRPRADNFEVSPWHHFA